MLIDKLIERFYSFYSRRIKFKKFYKNEVNIGHKSTIKGNVTIGKGTNIKSAFIIGGKEGVEIGKYCAIAHNLRIRSSNHEIRFPNLQCYFQVKYGINQPVHGVSKGKIQVGNNVWIGDNVFILPGVKIGNGVVIGAGSVVTKSIPSFGIAVGNPAKVIKYRFNDKVIESLERIRWWDWSDHMIELNKDFFKTDISNVDLIDFKLLKNEK